MRNWVERGGIFAAITLAAITFTGCGGGNSATVSGKVTFDGEAVPGGSITFNPVTEGRPAGATINGDGTYTLGTAKEADGALIGKHTITFVPPEDPSTDPTKVAPKSKYAGLTPSPAEVEVTSGDNTIDIQLVK